MDVYAIEAYPADTEKDFHRGHNHLDDHPESVHDPSKRIELHPLDIDIPEGYGMVTKPGFAGNLSQMSLHFQTAPGRDAGDL